MSPAEDEVAVREKVHSVLEDIQSGKVCLCHVGKTKRHNYITFFLI